MIEVNDFIPLEVVHPGSILAEELKERKIRQSDFAKCLGMTTGYLRCLLKGRIDFNEKIALQVENELGIPSSDWLTMQERYDKYSGYSEEDMMRVSLKSMYSHYEGKPIEEVVRLELEASGYTEEDLTEDQMERFKEEMIYRMDGGMILDGVLTEIPRYTPSQLKLMIRERLENFNKAHNC